VTTKKSGTAHATAPAAASQPPKRGAKPVAAPVPSDTTLDLQALSGRRQELVAMSAEATEREQRLKALASSIGYRGELSGQALMDGAYGAKHWLGMAAMEFGKYLLLLKAGCEHGQFGTVLARLEVSQSAASKYMSITRRFANRAMTHDLEKIGFSKMAELLVLEDDQVDDLAELGQTGELALDDVARMSVKELRGAVRKIRDDVEAKDRNIERLSQRTSQLEEKVDRAQRAWKKAAPDEQLDKLLEQARLATNNVRLAIAVGSEDAGLSGALIALTEHAHQHGQSVRQQIGGLIGDLIADLRLLRDGDQVDAAVVNDEHSAHWSSQNKEG
jgi:hypothetical protein